MRWLGQMQRAFELMCGYALGRRCSGAAGRQADGAELGGRLGGRDPGLPAAHPGRGRPHRPGGRGQGRDLGGQVLRRRVLHDVIDRAVQTHGALGLTDQTPLARMYADARAARFYDGPDEVHRMVVSRRVLRASSRAASGTSPTAAPGRPARPDRLAHPFSGMTRQEEGKPCLQSRTRTATASSPRCAATCPTSTSAARATAASPGTGGAATGRLAVAAGHPPAHGRVPGRRHRHRRRGDPGPDRSSAVAGATATSALPHRLARVRRGGGAGQPVHQPRRPAVGALREHTAIMNDLLNGKISAETASGPAPRR